MSNTTGDLKLTISVDAGQADKALNKLEKDAVSAGNSASVSLAKVEGLLESINAAAQAAAGSLGKPFMQASPEIEKYRISMQKLEKQVSTLQAQLDKLSKIPAPKAPEGPDVGALRAKWDPLFAISQKYKDNLAEIAQAEKLGALTTATANNARKDAASLANTQMLAVNRLSQGMTALNDSTKLTSNQMLNLSRQGNDALTMLASGSSITQVFATQLGQVYGALEEGPKGIKGSFDAIKGYALAAATAIGPVGLAVGGITIAVGALAMAIKRDVEPTEDILKRQAASVKALREEYKLVAPAAEDAGKRSRAAMSLGIEEQNKKDLFNLQRQAVQMQELPGVNALYNQRSRLYGQLEPVRQALKELQDTAKVGVPDFVAYRDALTNIAKSNAAEPVKDLAKFLLQSSEEAEKAARSYGGVSNALSEIKTRSNEARERLKELQEEFETYKPDNRSDAQKITDNFNKQIAAINQIVVDNPRIINGLTDSAAQQANAAMDKLAEGAKKKQVETAQALANVGLAPLQKSIEETKQRYAAEIEDYAKTKGDAAGIQALEAAQLNEITRLRKEAGVAATEEAEKVRKASDDRVSSLGQTVDQMRAEVETFGLTEGAAAAYEFRLNALSDAQQAVGANSIIPENERQAIEAAALQVGQYTDQLKEMNEQKRQSARLADFEADLNFGSQIRGLSEQDQAIAEKLRSVGVDYLSVQGKQYAAQMKFNDALKKTKDEAINFQDIGESLFDTLNEGLSKGEGLLKSFANTFAKIANQLASQAFGKLFGGMFGNSSQTTGIGGQGASASSIVTALGNTIGGASSSPSYGSAPLGAVSRAPLASIERTVVPAFNNASNSFTAAAKAIRTIESGSAAGNYGAIGPATRTGDRALGAYQMMGANLPQWSREAIGREIGKTEFLKSVELQDKIFEHRFGGYMAKYGPEGASRAWFAGEGGMKNYKATDVVGTSVSGYGGKFGSLYNQHLGGSATSVSAERENLRQGVSSGVIDAQKKIATGQAGVGGSDPWSGGGVDLRRLSGGASGGGGGLFGGTNGMTGAGSILGVQYPAFSAMGGISAGLGGFSSGYSSGSPVSGGLTGGLSGFMAGGPVGGLIGLGAGILGGVLGGRAQRKAKHQEAAKKWEEMRPAYEAFDKSLSGEGTGQLRAQNEELWGQLNSFMQVGGAAWKMGSGNSTAQFNSTGTKMFEKIFKAYEDFREAFEYTLEDLSSGQGLDGAFAKGRANVKALQKNIDAFVDDVRIAYGSADNGLPTGAPGDKIDKDWADVRAEAEAKAKKAAGEYALTMLYTADTMSDVQKTLDGFKGTAAGLQKVLEGLGWTADEASKAIADRLGQAISEMGKAFTDGFQEQINELEDAGYLNDFKELFKSRDTGIADAELLGVDPAIVTKWFNLAAQNVVDGAELTGDAFAELIKKFPELNGVVKEFAEEIESLQKTAKEKAVSQFDKLLNERAEAESRLQSAYEDSISFVKSIRSFLTDMKTDDTSTLSGVDQFQSAQKTYRDTLAKANAGDRDAQDQLLGVTQTYLDEAREYYASSDAYGAVWTEVNKTLSTTATKTQSQLDVMKSQANFLNSIDTNQKTLNVLFKDWMAANKAVSGAYNGVNQNRDWGINQSANKNMVSSLEKAGLYYTGDFGKGGFQAWLDGLSTKDRAKAAGAIGYKMGGIIPAYANGGIVGNGVWNQDSVLAKFAGGGHVALAGGEMITRATSVNSQTRGMLDHINRTGGLPGTNDNSRMEGVERKLDRLTNVVAQGFNMNVGAVEKGNMIAATQSESMKLAASK